MSSSNPAGVVEGDLPIDDESIRTNWRALDDRPSPLPDGYRIVGFEDSASRRSGGFTRVDWIPPSRFLSRFKRWRLIYELGYCVEMFAKSRGRTIVLSDNGDRMCKTFCVLNGLSPIRRTVVAFELYLGHAGPRGRFFSKIQLGGIDAAIVYSKTIRDRLLALLGAPPEKFWVVPFKSNVSRGEPCKLEIGGYVFSGGNSKRDYRTLIDAVRSTDVPLIISSNIPQLFAGIEIPPNVVIVSAKEPHFSRLMAGSRFVVLAIQPGLSHGAGEATVCDSMWHGRPVVVANETSLDVYIDEGVTGCVVPPSNPEALRAKILELWNDPGRCREMGRTAHESVRDNFTVKHFARRVEAVACAVARRKASRT